MNPLPALRRLLPRLQRQLLALSGDARRFLLLFLLWVLAMAASLVAGPVGALQDGGLRGFNPPAHTAPAPAPRAG
jgi:hypothetical protein